MRIIDCNLNHMAEIIGVENVAGNMETEISDSHHGGVDLRPVEIRPEHGQRSIFRVCLEDGGAEVCQFRGVADGAAGVSAAGRAGQEREQGNGCDSAHLAIAIGNGNSCDQAGADILQGLPQGGVELVKDLFIVVTSCFFHYFLYFILFFS